MNHWRLGWWISAPLLISCQAIIQGDPGTQLPPNIQGGAGKAATGGSAGSAGLGGGSGSGGAGATGGSTSSGGSTENGGALANGGEGPLGSGPLCDVEALLRQKCVSCHSSPPALRSVPMPIVTYDDLVAPSRSEPTKSVAVLSIERMQDTMSPMPPAPATPATAADVAVLQAWLDAGMPSSCDAGSAGATGAGGAGDVVENPYDTPTTCTTNQHWTRGDQESPNMHPGGECISCHTSGGEEEGPRFDFAGTVFPSAHEPTDCNGFDGQADPTEVIVIDANGTTITMTVNSVGNFSYQARGTTVALPYRAKVVRGGLERVMTAEQKSGDCNGCHTEAGKEDAPGRIMAP